MAEYVIAPVNSPPKGGGVRKYSPKDEDRGGNSRYQSGRREKQDDNKREPQKNFNDLFESRMNKPKKTEETEYMTAITFSREFTPPIVHSYKRAKILASTLAFELTGMRIAE